MTSIKQPNGKMAIKHLLAQRDQCCQRSCADINVSACVCVCAFECMCSLCACVLLHVKSGRSFSLWRTSVKDGLTAANLLRSVSLSLALHCLLTEGSTMFKYILIKGFRNNNGDNKDSPPSLSAASCRQMTLGGLWEEIGEEEGMEER